MTCRTGAGSFGAVMPIGPRAATHANAQLTVTHAYARASCCNTCKCSVDCYTCLCQGLVLQHMQMLSWLLHMLMPGALGWVYYVYIVQIVWEFVIRSKLSNVNVLFTLIHMIHKF